MGNRYTKTAFTSRQVKTLKSIQRDLLRIIDNRTGKRDDPSSLEALLRAYDRISLALDKAETWKRTVL